MHKILCEILDSLERAEMPLDKLRDAIFVARGASYGRDVVSTGYGSRMKSGALGNFYVGKLRRISALAIVKHLTSRR